MHQTVVFIMKVQNNTVFIVTFLPCIGGCLVTAWCVWPLVFGLSASQSLQGGNTWLNVIHNTHINGICFGVHCWVKFRRLNIVAEYNKL